MYGETDFGPPFSYYDYTTPNLLKAKGSRVSCKIYDEERWQQTCEIDTNCLYFHYRLDYSCGIITSLYF